MDPVLVVLLFVLMVLVMGGGYLFLRQRANGEMALLKQTEMQERSVLEQQLQTTEKELEQSQRASVEQQQRSELLTQQLGQGRELLSRQEERIRQFETMEEEYRRLQTQERGQQGTIAELETRLQEQERANQHHLKELEQAQQRMTVQFENIATRILEQKGKQFGEQHGTRLEEVLGPVKQQLGEFRRRIDEIHTHDTKERAGLKEHLTQLQAINQQMNREARNLTRALKGDKKAQGNWGEMILETVLEQSGLRRGVEYEAQGAFRDSDNKLLRPDVVIHMPGDKDVVVDSKVSLLDYTRYINAEDEDEAASALKGHIQAVRDHISGLSGKDYTALKGLRSLDFVLMFMPIETAFVVAFQADERLFSDAFEQRIVVVTPSTLLATLRTIENIWRYERQNENAIKISEKAGSVYDKLRGFLDEFEKLGNQLSTVQNTYDESMKKLSTGRGNLLRQADSFVEHGVKERKELSKGMVEQADRLE